MQHDVSFSVGLEPYNSPEITYSNDVPAATLSDAVVFPRVSASLPTPAGQVAAHSSLSAERR
jgi:hypothetical protein